jgi:hypothetical protein
MNNPETRQQWAQTTERRQTKNHPHVYYKEEYNNKYIMQL